MTKTTVINKDSNLLNYEDFWDGWYEDDEGFEECPSCRGTGLDRDEIYDCATCGGEGEIKITPLKFSTEVSLTIPTAT